MLPEETIAQLSTEYPCRQQAIQNLATLYAAHVPSPPFLNVYGLTATGKTAVLRSYFRISKALYAVINVRECITARHLLERIVAASLDALDEYTGEKIDRRPYVRTENLSALCVNLGKLLQGHEKFVLVLDALDRLREGGGGTLIPALARMGEAIPNLSLIVTTTLALTPSMLHCVSASFLHFAPYSRNQLLTILNASPQTIFLSPPPPELFPDYTPDVAAEDDAWLWARFLQAVYDSLSKHTGRDLVSFKRCALRLWRPFVEPITCGQFGTRDFSRLMINRRHLFQLEDPVTERIVNHNTNVLATTNTTTTTTTTTTAPPMPLHSLPYYSSHLLIAAYLASYNPARTDPTYFMKHTDKRKGRRRSTATAAALGTTPGKRSGTGSKHRKISRHLLLPSPFPLDRLLAIFRALLGAGDGHGVGAGAGAGLQNADVYTQIATLTSLRLLVRASGGGDKDALEAGARWRVNVGWEVVRGLGRSVGLEVGEFLVGGVE